MSQAETFPSLTNRSGAASPGAPPYVELHCASAFSFLRAGSSVEALVARAAALGLPALALTDHMTLAGVVRFQAACVRHGLRAVVGAELAVADPTFGDKAAPAELVVLARDAAGYAQLCRLLTRVNLRAGKRDPLVPLAELADAFAAAPGGLALLTGGRRGTLARLLLAGKRRAALEVAQRYAERFGAEHVWVELQHHRLPDSRWLMSQLAEIAAQAGLRAVATNGVHHAAREDYPLYDLLTCVRLGTTVDQPHAERPRNDEARLKGADEMTALFAGLPWGPAALAASAALAAQCDISLLRPACTAPRVPLPAGETPASYLRARCEAGLRARYESAAPEALLPMSEQRRQLDHELEVIAQLDLEEFFLCVAAIVAAARQMGVRCSGRGSAANSLVAFLLRVTGVDPLRHRLLFERFLNPDRRGMPDIDIDIQSDRRDEVIRHVERTYTPEHAAMVANVSTYRARGALRDTAKALGYPLDVVSKLTKVLPHHCGREELPGYADELAQTLRAALPEPDGAAALARCLGRLPLLLALTSRLCGLPRHLSLHNGGMVLAREPLTDILPVRLSANGVRALEINKDDVERLGLIKFDMLGLRALSAVEEAVELIDETTGVRLDVDALPTIPPDEATMRLVRAGQTLAVFQIESPGQWHLLAQTQPQTFDDLVIQTALFRPGPIQSNMVHPYVARRQDRQDRQQDQQWERPRDAVQAPWRQGEPPDTFWIDHPVLGPILRDSEGILLFQEQILEIAHTFAGLTYAEADGFRSAMSHQRSPEEMAAMRQRFVGGAMARGETEADARRVFESIAKFVGYGFCRSHAAEFARTIYQTAWLKCHYPAHYLAAFLNAQPGGFFPPHVVLEEAKLLGIPTLGPDVNRGEDRFCVERVGERQQQWAIRIGLRQVAHVGDELAEAILWERRGDRLSGGAERPFTSLADFCGRLRPSGLTRQAAESLALAGAFDGLAPRLNRRQRLWQLHHLWPFAGAADPRVRAKPRRGAAREPTAEQLTFDWLDGLASAEDDAEQLAALADIPTLPDLTAEERAALDYQYLGLSARPHPMRLLRRDLRRSGVRAIADLAGVAEGRVVRIAGWPISAQRPPTANGMGFLVVEDESGRLPVAVPPRLAEQMYRRICDARAVVVAGRVERVRWYRSMLALDLRRVA